MNIRVSSTCLIPSHTVYLLRSLFDLLRRGLDRLMHIWDYNCGVSQSAIFFLERVTRNTKEADMIDKVYTQTDKAPTM